MSNNILTVEYDEEGNRHYFRDGEEVEEATFLTQHPRMKTPKGNHYGRAGSSGSGRVGSGDPAVSAISAAAQVNEQGDDVKAQVRQGIREQRKRQGTGGGGGTGSAGDGMGQPRERSE